MLFKNAQPEQSAEKTMELLGVSTAMHVVVFFHQQMVRLTSAKAKGTAGLHLRLWKATTSTMCHLFGLHNSSFSENKVLPLCIENDCVFPIYDKRDASYPGGDRRARAYSINHQVRRS